ncbi:hypothetical protein FXO38_04289 [Capsicum annuum]|nr:hypothetical protein FXO38_04289 [Capsicum annuum]KAF3683183.1 hypothetical protein FXO37_01991 [Capsicum annuum]
MPTLEAVPVSQRHRLCPERLPKHFRAGRKQPSPELPSAQHRRVACSFRDQSLLQVFQISLTSMSQVKNDATISEDAASSKLQELALTLSLKCLSFDFMGTTVDESSDDFSTIQIPSSWKQVLEDQSTVQIFFDYYEISKPNISKESLAGQELARPEDESCGNEDVEMDMWTYRRDRIRNKDIGIMWGDLL